MLLLCYSFTYESRIPRQAQGCLKNHPPELPEHVDEHVDEDGGCLMDKFLVKIPPRGGIKTASSPSVASPAAVLKAAHSVPAAGGIKLAADVPPRGGVKSPPPSKASHKKPTAAKSPPKKHAKTVPKALGVSFVAPAASSPPAAAPPVQPKKGISAFFYYSMSQRPTVSTLHLRVRD